MKYMPFPLVLWERGEAHRQMLIERKNLKRGDNNGRRKGECEKGKQEERGKKDQA
jgi:hypothetical protein